MAMPRRRQASATLTPGFLVFYTIGRLCPSLSGVVSTDRTPLAVPSGICAVRISSLAN